MDECSINPTRQYCAGSSEWLNKKQTGRLRAHEGGDVTLENDELYTRVGENVPPPSESEDWTMTCIERNSRYWVSATVGRRDEQLFEQGVQVSWQWAEACQCLFE